MYQLTNLRHIYGTRVVLDLPTLEVREGEILAIVGPSGAGKSTLLRLLNFLEFPTSGIIRYRGQVVNPATPLAVRRQVTTVFQRPALMRASVRANVAYGLGLRGLPADGRLDEMLREVGLADLARQASHTLSGGEMQRVALARALVIQPRVLLLDEPTANLDPYNVTLIEELVRGHNARCGTTVVVVTHNIFQARRLAQRVGLLLNGSLVELADADRFFHAPSDPRAAAFVRGEMVY
jgi:tungstate transport system ATP-binding protein